MNLEVIVVGQEYYAGLKEPGEKFDTGFWFDLWRTKIYANDLD